MAMSGAQACWRTQIDQRDEIHFDRRFHIFFKIFQVKVYTTRHSELPKLAILGIDELATLLHVQSRGVQPLLLPNKVLMGPLPFPVHVSVSHGPSETRAMAMMYLSSSTTGTGRVI